MRHLSKPADMKVIAWPAFKTRYKNPYNWLLYSHMPSETVSVTEFSSKRLLTEKFDIFHLHWPIETLVRHPNIWVARLRAISFWLLLRLSRWRGTKIVWTIHDENPHVVLHQELANWIQDRLVAATDSYINLCTAGETAVEQTLQQLAHKPNFVISHGHYRDCYPNEISKTEAQLKLGLKEEADSQTITLLYLGYISPYKNVPHLIRTFCQLPKTGQKVRLLVAGKPDNTEIESAVRTSASQMDNVHLYLQFIEDEALQTFFNAADIVVLPFEEILNSGSLLLALSFNCPVIAPALGAIAQWQEQIGTDWIKTYQGTLTPEVLQTAIADYQEPTDCAPLESLNWDTIAGQTLDAYKATLLKTA